MSRPVVAYVRKGCLTCKRALDYMERLGIDYEKVDLVDSPLSTEELEDLIRKLGLRPREVLRPRDRMYRELDLKNRQLSDQELIELMTRHPGLIKRPILVRDERAVLAIDPKEVERLV